VTPDEIQAHVIKALARVAPEARSVPLASTVNLRDQLDIDSMDFLNFVIALHHDLGVEIPETDYPELVTLDRAVRYLGERLATQDRPRP
jgi:acyl carrier protein